MTAHQPIVAGGIVMILLWVRLTDGTSAIPVAWLVVVGSLGAWWTGLGIVQSVRRRREAAWVRSWGRVTQVTTELVPFPRAGVRPQARVHYEYHVGATAWAGYADQLDTPVSANDAEVAAIRALYPPGRRVELQYDPREPKRSRLRVTHERAVVPVLLSGIGLVSATFAFYLW